MHFKFKTLYVNCVSFFFPLLLPPRLVNLLSVRMNYFTPTCHLYCNHSSFEMKLQKLSRVVPTTTPTSRYPESLGAHHWKSLSIWLTAYLLAKNRPCLLSSGTTSRKCCLIRSLWKTAWVKPTGKFFVTRWQTQLIVLTTKTCQCR